MENAIGDVFCHFATWRWAQMDTAVYLSRECVLNDDVWFAGYMKQISLKTYLYVWPNSCEHVGMPLKVSALKLVLHATKSLCSVARAQTIDLAVCSKHYGFPHRYRVNPVSEI